jgi:hypothetical protein
MNKDILEHIANLTHYDKLKAMTLYRDILLHNSQRYGKSQTAKMIIYDYSAFCLWIKHTEPYTDEDITND